MQANETGFEDVLNDTYEKADAVELPMDLKEYFYQNDHSNRKTAVEKQEMNVWLTRN